MDMGYLTLTGGYKMEALESSLEMIGWRRLSERNVAITCVQLHGIAQVNIAIANNADLYMQ